jgi:acylphosphatase
VSEPALTQPANQRLHAIVYGRVQGVGFRFFVLQQAVEMGLNGWVRNLPEGTVEVLAEGNIESLQELLTDLYQGPDAAFVRDVKYNYSSATGEFSGFDIRYH